jgi:hypothetical protein
MVRNVRKGAIVNNFVNQVWRIIEDDQGVLKWRFLS